MSPADFTVWLRGFMAALAGTPMTATQAEVVRVELAKVVTPYPWTLTVFPLPANPLPVNPMPWGQPSTVCAGTTDFKTFVGGGSSFINNVAGAVPPSQTFKFVDVQS